VCGAGWSPVVERESHFTDRPGHPTRYCAARAGRRWWRGRAISQIGQGIQLDTAILTQ
jgi:hypothetical protein